MSFSIELTEVAEKDIEKFKKTGNKKILQEIDMLLDELRQHPTGKPEQLKHYDTPTWSRRISDKYRLIYRIQEDKIVVLVLSLWGHYGNKYCFLPNNSTSHKHLHLKVWRLKVYSLCIVFKSSISRSKISDKSEETQHEKTKHLCTNIRNS